MKPSLAPVASAWKLATSAPPQPATQSSAPPTTTADQNRVPEKQKRNLDTNNWPSLPSQAQCQPEASFRKPQKHLRWTDMSFDAPTPELSGIETSSSLSTTSIANTEEDTENNVSSGDALRHNARAAINTEYLPLLSEDNSRIQANDTSGPATSRGSHPMEAGAIPAQADVTSNGVDVDSNLTSSTSYHDLPVVSSYWKESMGSRGGILNDMAKSSISTGFAPEGAARQQHQRNTRSDGEVLSDAQRDMRGLEDQQVSMTRNSQNGGSVRRASSLNSGQVRRSSVSMSHQISFATPVQSHAKPISQTYVIRGNPQSNANYLPSQQQGEPVWTLHQPVSSATSQLQQPFQSFKHYEQAPTNYASIPQRDFSQIYSVTDLATAVQAHPEHVLRGIVKLRVETVQAKHSHSQAEKHIKVLEASIQKDRDLHNKLVTTYEMLLAGGKDQQILLLEMIRRLRVLLGDETVSHEPIKLPQSNAERASRLAEMVHTLTQPGPILSKLKEQGPFEIYSPSQDGDDTKTEKGDQKASSVTGSAGADSGTVIPDRSNYKKTLNANVGSFVPSNATSPEKSQIPMHEGVGPDGIAPAVRDLITKQLELCFQVVCPHSLLFAGEECPNKNCVMQKVCPLITREQCADHTCPKFHSLQTCSFEANDEKCPHVAETRSRSLSPVKSGQRNTSRMKYVANLEHFARYVHENACSAKEWNDRKVLKGLCKSHYMEGGYMGYLYQ